MRITCGRALFEFYANLLESFSMRLLIRIRVDTPFSATVSKPQKANRFMGSIVLCFLQGQCVCIDWKLSKRA